MRHQPPKPRGPAAFADYESLLAPTLAFTADDRRVFVRIPAANAGTRILDVRSGAFRDWFSGQYYLLYDTIPTAHTFGDARRYLEARAALDPDDCDISVPRRVDQRGSGAFPDKLFIDLANTAGEFVEITPGAWKVTTTRQSNEGVPFETSRSTVSLPTPEPPPVPTILPSTPSVPLSTSVHPIPPAGSAA